jgi:hypothetical protein
MICTTIETLSWGVTTAFSSLIIATIFDFDRKTIRNILICSFIFGCIRGYTGKNVCILLLT